MKKMDTEFNGDTSLNLLKTSPVGFVTVNCCEIAS